MKSFIQVVLSNIGAIPGEAWQVATTTNTVEESECCDGIIPGAVAMLWEVPHPVSRGREVFLKSIQVALG